LAARTLILSETKDALAHKDDVTRNLLRSERPSPRRVLILRWPRPSTTFRLILRCARPSTTAVLILRCEGALRLPRVLILRCEGEARASKERTRVRSG
jgi:hypothetical protein